MHPCTTCAGGEFEVCQTWMVEGRMFDSVVCPVWPSIFQSINSALPH